MIWATLDVDLLDDPVFLEMREEDPAHLWRWLRIVQVAIKAQEDGKILLTDGRPATEKTLALMDREKPGPWRKLFEFCKNSDLIHEDPEEKCWVISDWLRYFYQSRKKPSARPSRVAERVKRYRDRQKQAGTGESGDSEKSNCNATGNARNACNAPQNRTELNTELNTYTEHGHGEREQEPDDPIGGSLPESAIPLTNGKLQFWGKCQQILQTFRHVERGTEYGIALDAYCELPFPRDRLENCLREATDEIKEAREAAKTAGRKGVFTFPIRPTISLATDLVKSPQSRAKPPREEYNPRDEITADD